MSERLLFFICFMWKSPLWYLGMLKIQFFYYFSISRPKNNVDSSKISLFLDVSIKRQTNKINERTFSFFFICFIRGGFLLASRDAKYSIFLLFLN